MEQVAIIPLVSAITEMIKRWGIPSKFAPIVSIFVGIIIAFIFAQRFDVDIAVQGIIFGLSASGLYSGAIKPIITVKAEK